MVGALALVTGAFWCIIAFRPIRSMDLGTSSCCRAERGVRRAFGTSPAWPQTSEMKEISAEILTPAQAVGAEKSWPAVFADLVKARLTTLVLLTTLVGFYAGWSGPMNFVLMFNTLAATALVAAGAAALNQLLESEYDAKMRRTQDRPLPSGRLQPATVAIFGGVSSVAGLVYLALASESAHERARRGDARQLPFHLHAVQARDVVEHGHRRDSRRVSAAHGLDGGARRIDRRRLGAVRHPGVLANSAFFRHRVDLSRRIRESRFHHAAERGCRAAAARRNKLSATRSRC